MMLWPASVRVYVCLTPCDMRRSFDGLHALVRDHLRQDAFGGHLYLFSNRRRDRVKLLYWDRDGFAVWAKRRSGSQRDECGGAQCAAERDRSEHGAAAPSLYSAH